MKYKVGDKVKVRSDLVINEQYGDSDVFNDHVGELSGKMVTISEVRSNYYRLAEDEYPLKYNWTDEMFESKGDGKLKGYDLMKLAAENPQKYEGKKYKALHYCPNGSGKTANEVIVRDGKLYTNSAGVIGVWAYINSNTELEEIPQSVSFIEAVKAYSEGKMICCKLGNSSFQYKPFYGMLKSYNGNAVTAKQILEGKWFIE